MIGYVNLSEEGRMSNSQLVPRRKTLLVILDGFGVNPSKKNNAVYEASTPCLDHYFGHYAHTTLSASGRAVGLPDGQMGNSEVGHLTIGCGSILRQDLVRIDDAIEDGTLAENRSLKQTLEQAKRTCRPLHLIGLVSDGGVHSHISHLKALLVLCANAGVETMVHVITDGRDTSPKSALGFIEDLQETLSKTGGQIASICGRYYAMDRDRRWDRIQLAWNAYVQGEGIAVDSPTDAIHASYEIGEFDEFIKPYIMKGFVPIQGGDSVLFFNFRNDRPRQMAEALAMPSFDGFDRGDFKPIHLTTMTLYDPQLPAQILFEPDRPKTNLAQTISNEGIQQFHCAETEKYAHVTFFFNSGNELAYEGEDRLVVDSPKVQTYDEKPEMSAKEVADAVVNALAMDKYGFVVVNFANGDMVGHTAVADAIVQAIEAMDHEVGRVLEAAVMHDYSVILTADHGNCEEYLDPITREPNTQHTTYPVPCLLMDKDHWRLSNGAGLANIAPTVLQLMGIKQPDSMAAKSILLEKH